MEHVNGSRGVTPPYLVNGGAASPTGPLGAARPARATSVGLPVSSAGLAASLSLAATSAGLVMSPAGLTVTPAGLSVTPVPAAVPGVPPSSGRQSVPALSRSPMLPVPALPPAGVVFSRNRYGQVTMTSQPTNESELQLYRVLQHANLLSYYDVFISQGGDDVQQLCEAGEDEFLEIMALVGMASKPLHVRRLQKALQEWVSAPAKFHVPMLPVPPAGFLPSRGMVAQLVPTPAPTPASVPVSAPVPAAVPASAAVSGASGPPAGSGQAPPPPARTPPAPSSTARSTPPAGSPTPSLGRDRDSLPSPSQSQNSHDQWPGRGAGGEEGGEPYPTSGSPLQLTPTLRKSQIRRLAEAALHVAKTLPDFEPRQQNSSKRKVCKELDYVVGMEPTDPNRLDKIREYAAIYGRFDCKRKAEKPLTLHEVSVNEAAAQLCLHVPALLTRRDELFPLSRQVVRDSGYQYSKGHSRSQGAQSFSPRDLRLMDEMPGAKRMRMDSDSPTEPDSAWRARQDRLDQIADELRRLQERREELRQLQERGEEPAPSDDPLAVETTLQQQIDGVEREQRQLISEQTELVHENKQSYKSCLEFYDDDSQYSLSSAPSPPGGDSSRDGDMSRDGDKPAARLAKKLAQETLVDEGLRVVRGLVSQREGCSQLTGPATATADAPALFPQHKVIASAAGTIIAVANPALSMSQLSQPGGLVSKVKTEPSRRVKVEPSGSPPSTNGRRPAD